MTITGKVSAVMPAQSGTSQRTGNAWMSQEFVVEFFSGQYARHACFKLFGQERIANVANLLVVGNDVTVSFDIDSREFNGRYYTSLDAWKVEQGVAVSNPAAPMPQAIPAPAPSVQMPPAPQVNGGGDELPF